MASPQDGEIRKRKRQGGHSIQHEPKRARVEPQASLNQNENGTISGHNEIESPASSRALANGHPSRTTKDAQSLDATSKSNNVNGELVTESTTAKRRKRKKQQEKEIEPIQIVRVQKSSSFSRWTIAEPIGGSFHGMRPLFSDDEKHIIVATQSSVNVYSTNTSLLVHSLSSGSHGAITGYSLSTADGNMLYAVTAKGIVMCWNWLTGERIGRWDTGAKALDVAVAKVNKELDMLFVIDHVDDFKITAHQFGGEDDRAKTELSTLFSTKKPLRSLRLIDNARIIVAMSDESILCGVAIEPHPKDLKDLEYTWNEIHCAEAPTCFDVIVQSSLTTSSTREESDSTTASNNLASLDFAVGTASGRIYVYHDLLNKIKPAQKRNKNALTSVDTTAQELHWHREAVQTIASSRDGQYFISGGQETVLVLWQLATGKKQFLPHLESPIEHLTVAPSGTSYAVRLGDNSVMVLSTAELAPYANIAGLQSILASAYSRDNAGTSLVNRHDEAGRVERVEACLAAVNPRDANQLLLAVPSSQSNLHPGSYTTPTPYLQTFDMRHARHVSRQALTRTNATNTNLGPDGYRVQEPNVTLMGLSNDGSWLATVDEWAFFLHEDLPTTTYDTNVDARVETHLKFWIWDSSREAWALNTRIERPHQTESSRRAIRTVALATSPVKAEFATIGEDANLRIWSCRSQTYDRATTRRSDTTQQLDRSFESWWTLSAVVSLERSSTNEPLQTLWPSSAKVAYSEDGTVIACSLHFQGQWNDTVYFVDAASNAISECQSNICFGLGEICALAFLDRNLICATSNAVEVWDVTSFEQLAFIPLRPHEKKDSVKASEPRLVPQLAVDSHSGTFAVALPNRKSKRLNGQTQTKYWTNVKVCSPISDGHIIFQTDISSEALALLPANPLSRQTDRGDTSRSFAHGYLLLDSQATIRHIRAGRPASVPNPVSEPVPMKQTQRKEDSRQRGILVRESEDAGSEEETAAGEQQLADLGALADARHQPVVRPEQLDVIFDHPSHAMPPMRDLFSDVVRLYAGRV